MRARISPLAAALVGLALAAIAGCGSSSDGNGVTAKTPAEIVYGAKVLADKASSVHVSGSIRSGGSPLTLDLHLLSSKGGRGALSENGLSFELIQIHGNVFIKGSPALYRRVVGATAAQLLQGRWLKAPATSGDLGSLASLTNLRQLLDVTLAGHGALVKGVKTVVDGRRVIGVTDSSNGGTLYVATTGPPYPIAVTKSGAGAGTVVFDHWNGPVSVTAPENAIDITQLSGH